MLSSKLSYMGGAQSLIWKSISSFESGISSVDENLSKLNIAIADESNKKQSSHRSTLGDSILEKFKSTFNRISKNK